MYRARARGFADAGRTRVGGPELRLDVLNRDSQLQGNWGEPPPRDDIGGLATAGHSSRN